LNQGIHGFPQGISPNFQGVHSLAYVEKMNSESVGNSANVFYPPWGSINLGSGTTVTANRLALLPFYISKPVIVTAICCRSYNNSVGSDVIFGLYKTDPSYNLPSDLLFQSASIAVGSGSSFANNTVDTTNALQVDAGWYYAASVFSAAAVMDRATSTFATVSTSPVAAYQSPGLYIAHTFNTLPLTLTGRKLTMADSVTAIPFIALQMRSFKTNYEVLRT